MFTGAHTSGGHIVSRREAAEARLRGSCYLALRDVCCDDRGGVLRLFGRLPSQYLRQLALALACEVAGPAPVAVEIEVEGTAPRGRGGYRPTR
jgi:hypothetical protein